jgi:hypothetical protein
MIATWYNSPGRIAALTAAAARWVGTPFRENSAVCGKGGGVSCHNLAAVLYFETGCMSCFDVPRGRVRDFLHKGAGDAIIGYLDAHLEGRFQAVPVTEPTLPGDMVVMREGKTAKHVGVVIAGGAFVHVLLFRGVMISRLDDSTYQPLAAIRRPMP